MTKIEAEFAPKISCPTVILPDYDRKLQYEIRREAKAAVIKPEFDFKAEGSRYVLWHLLSEKGLAKHAKQGGQLAVPQRLQEREEILIFTYNKKWPLPVSTFI